MTTATATDDTPTIDDQRAAAFADQLFGFYTGGFVTFMIDLGVRTGLFDAAAEGPATSEQLAARAGLQERYVREWLGAVVTAGIIDYDPDTEVAKSPVSPAASQRKTTVEAKSRTCEVSHWQRCPLHGRRLPGSTCEFRSCSARPNPPGRGCVHWLGTCPWPEHPLEGRHLSVRH